MGPCYRPSPCTPASIENKNRVLGAQETFALLSRNNRQVSPKKSCNHFSLSKQFPQSTYSKMCHLVFVFFQCRRCSVLCKMRSYCKMCESGDEYHLGECENWRDDRHIWLRRTRLCPLCRTERYVSSLFIREDISKFNSFEDLTEFEWDAELGAEHV